MPFQIEVAPRPVEPRHLIVLRIGIVVALLGSAKFVAGREHDRAARGKQRGQKRAASSRRLSSITCGSALSPSTPLFQEKFSLWPSRLLLAIRLIVLALVAHQIGQRHAVMSGDEIDRSRLVGPLRCRKHVG